MRDHREYVVPPDYPPCPATRGDHDWDIAGIHVRCAVCCAVPCCSKASRGKSMETAVKRRKVVALRARDGDRCYWCGVAMVFVAAYVARPDPHCATVDHLVTRRDGGGADLSNLVLACHRCNQLRQDLPASEWESSSRLHVRRMHVMKVAMRLVGKGIDGKFIHAGKFERLADGSHRCPSCGTVGWARALGSPQIQDFPCSPVNGG